MKITRLDVKKMDKIHPNRIVKKKVAGNCTEIKCTQRRNRKAPIKRLKENKYLDCKTGEIGECKKSEKRIDQPGFLRKTFKDICDLLNTNLTEDVFALFVTLTYRENMQDREKLLNDSKKFHKKFRYYCETRGYEIPRYISVVEPQARGAWHSHNFYIWENNPCYITNDILSNMWGHGFTHMRWVDTTISNFGAYFSAYLTDIPVEEYDKDLSKVEIVEKEVIDENGEIVSKKFVKGGRLGFYPSHFKIYRYSKGIKKPTITEETYAEATADLDESQKTYEYAYYIEKGSFNTMVRGEIYDTSSGGEDEKNV